MKELKVPALGESISEATISKWLKSEGQAINVDDALVELETDKVTVEVPSPIAGVLSEILASEGSNVEVGAVLARLDPSQRAAVADKSAASDSVEKSKKVAPSEIPVAAPAPPLSRPEPVSVPASDPGGAPFGAPGGAPVGDRRVDSGSSPVMSSGKAGPAVRKAAASKGIDLASVSPTGLRGTVTSQDLARASSPVKAGDNPPVITGEVTRVPMSRLRQRVAERLKFAQSTAAILTTFNEVDMSNVIALRRRHGEEFQRNHGIKLGFMGFFIKAVVQALKHWPAVNAEISGSEIIYHHYYDIGIAVGAPQGLVVPVLRACEQKDFAEIEAQVADFGQRAREGNLKLEDLTGGTFSVTNGGIFGSMMSTPILKPPQSAILGLHKIEQRPVAVDGEVVIKPMMYVAMSYDHRLIDGREAVLFLYEVKSLIEEPSKMLLS